MLEELARHIFVGGVLARQLQCDAQQVQAIHAHPAGAVRLLDITAGGKRGAAVENADIVETKEAALKDVSSVGVLAVHPPGKVQQELLKNPLEKFDVAFSPPFLFE